MEFQIIVALDSQNGIGKSNSIPWHLPPDMAFFKQKTSTAKQNYYRLHTQYGRSN